MSFFKKNKPKSKKAKIPPKPDQTTLEREIASMNQDLNLDQQLEELTAKLNIDPDKPVTAEALASKSIMDEGAAETSPGIGGVSFVKDSLTDFVPPSFSASLANAAGNIDVTPKDDHIDKLISESRQMVSPAPASAPQAQIPDDLPPAFIPDPSLASPGRLDIGVMRTDVAKISADIQSGEELYRRALQRVEGLMGLVEKAEIDFSVLNRLEPENRRLKARLRTVQGDIEAKKNKLSVVMADLEDHQDRLAEKTAQYETARERLTVTTKSLQEYERHLKKTKSEAERYVLAVERQKTALGVESRENRILREKLSEISEALQTRQADYLEAKKMAESLKTDCGDYRDQADVLRAEVNDLRIALSAAKKQNNAMKGEMLSLHEDIKNFKTQYEFNVINREDQVTDLESQLAFLAKEVDAKEEVARQANEDAARLRQVRNQQDIERDRLEKQLQASIAEVQDVTRLSGEKSAHKLSALQNDVAGLQTKLDQREEMATQTSRENEDLRREIRRLEIDGEQLNARLQTQAGQMETLQNSSPVAALEAKIGELTKDLKIKNEIVQNAARDVTDLRKMNQKQDEGRKRLEKLIETQTYQLKTAEDELLRSKHDTSELDQRYKDVAAALSMAQTRRSAEGTAETPDIHPRSETFSHDYDGLSDTDIEDRIMDYKLGLRKDIL